MFREGNFHLLTRNMILLLDYLLWRIFDFSKYKKIRLNNIKRILVIHLGAMGEVFISSPIFYGLNKKFDCKIDLIVKEGKEEIIKNNPFIGRILHEKDLEKIKNKYDLAIAINPCSYRIGYLLKKANIKYVFGGFGGLRRFPGFFFTRRNYPISRKHALKRCMEIVKPLDIKQKQALRFYSSKEDEKKASMKIESFGKKDYFVIHPHAGDEKEFPSRLWPTQNYSKTIDKITKKFGVNVLITGAEKDKTFSKEIYKKVNNKKKVFIMTGKLTLGELANIISKSKLLIGPSTSVIHIASSYNIPVINLLSKKMDIYTWHPLMDKKNYKILFDPTTIKINGKNRGMVKIKPGHVVNAIEKIFLSNPKVKK